MSDGIKQRVERAAAKATWEHEHRWGPSFGDATLLRVTRVDGGPMTLSYGGESVEIRKDLVGPLAEMIAAAAAWTDEQTDEGADG